MFRFMYPGFFGFNPWFGFVGLYMPLIFLVGLMVSILWYARKSRRQKPLENLPRDPLEILTERFAKGEIDVDEFESTVSILEAHRNSKK